MPEVEGRAGLVSFLSYAFPAAQEHLSWKVPLKAHSPGRHREVQEAPWEATDRGQSSWNPASLVGDPDALLT